MFDPIQQQAGQTLLRGIANQATLGALPYPEEPVPDSDRTTRPGWLRLVTLNVIARVDRALSRGSRTGRPHPARGSTAESI